ncbi:DUF262 domain-containing protein [Leptospira vanthielii]|uniref:DUF262 domain-containing protein n=1 Tax=Leptospira vanthielii TaxID=293085 RepID=A0ABY2NUC5_9LEPT|nr:DUF262 domain-containing protein [Leptospira vanthielii]TGM61898.1 DUF262 domain-containing protein [Leptospira vanthielii]
MELSIRDVITKINDGNIRIPSFQREFVWEPDEIAYFIDSIYKNFPFGTIQLWRTKFPLRFEKEFGPFKLFDRDPDYPIDYVLDGQQRLTSLFGVFQTEIELDSTKNNPFNLYFILNNKGALNSSSFTPLATEDYDPNIYFPINCIFDTKKYREATKHLAEKDMVTIDNLQSIFKETKIPIQILETNEKTKVAIVFERINRKGQDLNIFQLLTAWTWSEDFELKEKFTQLQDELEPYGFGNVGTDINLILRIISAILTENANPESLLDLDSSLIRNEFDQIENGIKGAIDFLKTEFKIEKISNLPFENLLIPLSYFFSIKGNKQFNLTNQQRISLIKWFWRVCFSKRYSAGTINAVNEDIGGMKKIKNNSNSIVDLISARIDQNFFTNNKLSFNSVNTKTFILLLIQKNPQSFISGKNINLSDVLNKYNRNEFHHIYPVNFLKTISNKKFNENCFSNFAVLSRADNNFIKDKKPSIYIDQIHSSKIQILNSSFCEPNDFDDNFNSFIERRNERLMNFARELIK